MASGTVVRRSSAIVVALGMLFARVTHAQGNDAGRAEELFQAGKARLAEKDYAHACPLLSESFELDAATGTLLALALCHEREGKLASAYRNYSEAVARAIKDARLDRERAAREKLTALAPQLSRLTISITDQPELQSLTVRRNGEPLDRDQWGQAIPVDGGTHRIDVSLQGKNTWHADVAIAASGDTKIIIVPVLEDDSKVVAVPVLEAPKLVRKVTPPAQNQQAPVEAPPAREDTSSTLRWAGLGTVGLASLGVSTYFSIQAVNKNRKSNLGCDGNNVCTPEARQDRLAARRFGNLATVTGVAGGVLVASGAVLFVLSRHSDAEEGTPKRRIVGTPWIAPHAAGAAVSGSF